MRTENMGKIIQVKIKRVDSIDSERLCSIEVDPNMSYNDLKKKILDLLNIEISNNKIIKLRNSDGFLIPVSSLLEDTDSNKPFIIEVTGVHQNVPAINFESPINTVYIDAVRLKLRNMEARISRVESIVPQLKWRRQSLLEHTTCTLGSKIAFLDKRIDELTPPQWNQHLPKSVS